MVQAILIIIGLAVIVLLLTQTGREAAGGICSSALDQTVRKNANKDNALAFLRDKKEAGNDDIRECLGVSRRSAARYLDELEKEGKIEQVGDIGRGVIYRLK